MKNIENLTISDYVAMLRRRIWYVVVATLLVSAATVVYVKQLPSIYRSETTISISSRFLPEDYIRSIDRQTSADRMDFVRQQLQNRSFMEAIVQEFRLAGPDGIQGAAETVRNKIEVTVFTSTAFKLGFAATDPALAQAITKRLAERVIQLNDSFRKEKVQVADQFLEEQLQQAKDELEKAEQQLMEFRNRAFAGLTSDVVTGDTLRDLQSQLTKLDTQLDSARDQRKSLERRLEEQRQLKLVLKTPPPPPATAAAQQQVGSPRQPSPLEIELANRRAQLASASARYTPLHPEVSRLRHEVQELESEVRQYLAANTPNVSASVSAPESKDEAKQSPPSPALETTFPTVDLLPAEIQQEMNQVDREIGKTQQARNALAARISSYQARLNPSPEVAQELGQRTRDYEAAKQRYTLLSDKRITSEMAARADSSESNEMFNVVDPAYLPRLATGPNRRLLALIGVLAGLVLGFGLAFLREYMDSSLHSEEEAIAELSLPILASVPLILEQNKQNVKRLSKVRGPSIVPVPDNPEDAVSHQQMDAKLRNVILNPLCVATEHYRLLHTNLLAIQRGRPLKSILVSSARPGEGKTLSACCIAGILAQEAGKKVLLIDADLRRPNVAETLGLRQQQPPKSFSAVLHGQADIEESIIRLDSLNLHVLLPGVSSNPAEILNSPRLQYLLRECTEAFDWVIVDSPPILAAADVNMLIPFVDAMLLIVHAGKTPVKLVKDSVKRVGSDRILGLLMNQGKTMESSHYYGSYYGPIVQPSPKTSILKSFHKL